MNIKKDFILLKIQLQDRKNLPNHIHPTKSSPLFKPNFYILNHIAHILKPHLLPHCYPSRSHHSPFKPYHDVGLGGFGIFKKKVTSDIGES